MRGRNAVREVSEGLLWVSQGEACPPSSLLRPWRARGNLASSVNKLIFDKWGNPLLHYFTVGDVTEVCSEGWGFLNWESLDEKEWARGGRGGRMLWAEGNAAAKAGRCTPAWCLGSHKPFHLPGLECVVAVRLCRGWAVPCLRHFNYFCFFFIVVYV